MNDEELDLAGSAPGANSDRPDPGDPARRVLVAMSGGVDSAVAAARLLQEGYDVAGVTFRLYCYGELESGRRACCGLEGIQDAQRSASRLGIPHLVLDLEELFRLRVLDDFVREYGAGRTPNPCVECNTHVKFRPLLDWADRQGYARIATGHYARRKQPGSPEGGSALIGRAVDREKDQSYVLWGVPPEVAARVLFPLGGLTKAEVRAEAARLNLPVWDKEESQDICFVPDGDYAAVVRAKLDPEHPALQPGEIRDLAGRLRGRHPGLIHFTVGQRRGLGLGGGEPLRVVALEPTTRTLRVGPVGALARGGLWAGGLVLHVSESKLAEEPVEVQIRYRHRAAEARCRLAPGPAGPRLHVAFRDPQEGISPGQSCVVYRDGWLLAGGRIESSCDCCPPLGC